MRNGKREMARDEGGVRGGAGKTVVARVTCSKVLALFFAALVCSPV